MKLTDIDLNDKTEVAAAHALLAALLGVPELTTDPQPEQDAASVFGAAPLSEPPATGAQEPASAPPSSGGTSGAPAAGVELDSSGLPWDARIHASTKSQKKDGTWTALRGLNDEAKVKQIEAELRASVAQGATPLPLPLTLPGMPQSSPVPTAPLAALASVPAASALLPSQPAGTPAPSADLPGAADPVTFEQLMPRVTQATVAGVLPPMALMQACTALGLPSVVALQQQPACVPHVWAQLKAAYPALV